MGEYDGCFCKLEREAFDGGGALPGVQAYFRGERSLPGARIYLPYRALQAPGVIDGEPHFHRDEEYLAFVGHDLRDPFESFDAEIELWLGEDRNDMERIVITAPSMIRVPKFYWHGPITVRRLGKPLFFQPILYSSRNYAVQQKTDSSGHIYYRTICEGVSPCVRDNTVLCSLCGRCFCGEEAE